MAGGDGALHGRLESDHIELDRARARHRRPIANATLAASAKPIRVLASVIGSAIAHAIACTAGVLHIGGGEARAALLGNVRRGGEELAVRGERGPCEQRHRPKWQPQRPLDEGKQPLHACAIIHMHVVGREPLGGGAEDGGEECPLGAGGVVYRRAAVLFGTEDGGKECPLGARAAVYRGAAVLFGAEEGRRTEGEGEEEADVR